MPMIGKQTFKCFQCADEISSDSPNPRFFRKIIKHMEKHLEFFERLAFQFKKYYEEANHKLEDKKKEIADLRSEIRLTKVMNQLLEFKLNQFSSLPSEKKILAENDKISLGLVVNFFDRLKGAVPIIVFPEELSTSKELLSSLANKSFSTLGFVSNPEEDKYKIFQFQLDDEQSTVFGYAFSFNNPEAHGGQENLNICFVIKPPWGDSENLDKVSHQILERFRLIRDLMKEKSNLEIIHEAMKGTRNFFTWKMLLSV